MKKLSVVFVALAAAFCAVNASALEATVVSVKGKVEIQEAGLWVSLEEGDTVEKGTIISTGFNSEAVLSVKESNFTLGPLTRITVEDLTSAGAKDNTQLFIDSGSISVAVDSAEGRRTGFKVRSPVATASVRGTEFKLSSSGKITVHQGLVSFGPSESSKPEITPDVEEKAEVKAEEAKVESAPSSSTATAAAVETAEEAVAVAEEKPASKADKDDAKAAAKAEKAEAKAAAKAEKEAAKAEKAAAKKHDNAFASTDDVGGFTGVPVAAGQTSKTNAITGSQSSPRSELAAASVGAKSAATVTETAKQAQSTASGSSSAAASSDTPVVPVEPPKPEPVAPTTGSIKISVSFAD
ncbi:MAG: FecR domain-containing protein [Treponema sp.]|nr:FecR domain-containing protein [Treponema sp.]